MVAKKCSDADFINAVKKHGVNKAAKVLGMNLRTITRRLKYLQNEIGLTKSIYSSSKEMLDKISEQREFIESIRKEYKGIKNAVIIVGSDAHYWPQKVPTCAHRAFVKMCKQLKPDFVIMNGDAFDGAEISRHPRNGWNRGPSVIDELNECKARLAEIAKASKGAKLLWPYGNHDMRFEARLVQNAPEFVNVYGTRLSDHFPDWQACISVHINDVVIKHRYHGGVHAAYNNTLKSGKSIVTGHLHNLNCTRFTDYNGPRFGIDTGMMADMYDRQFSYTEDGPVNWQSGFVVLTIANGKLLRPEFVDVIDQHSFSFRGKIHAA